MVHFEEYFSWHCQFANPEDCNPPKPFLLSAPCTRPLASCGGLAAMLWFWGAHLLVLVGEGEPLNGVLHGTPTHAAQPVLQLQQLLQHGNSSKRESALLTGGIGGGARGPAIPVSACQGARLHPALSSVEMLIEPKSGMVQWWI